MKTPETSKHFIRWRDPLSGRESYILDSNAAGFFQNFYYVNNGFSGDGRFLWFYCAYPPSGNKCLGLIDFEDDRLCVFHTSEFLDASPMVAPETGEAFWISGAELFKLAPHPEAKPVFVNRFPDDLVRNRRPRRIATHLTLSSDGRNFAIDAEFGRDWFIGEMPLDGSECRIWEHFDYCVNHAQFSPSDPDLIMYAHDGWDDCVSGQHFDYRRRIWLIRRGKKARPLFDFDTPLHGHEWWSSDGRYIWYVHYTKGTFKADINGKVFPEWQTEQPVSHSHSSTDDRLIVSDMCSQDEPEMKVAFKELEEGNEATIVSAMPHLMPLCRKYHVHPHPRFCVGDKYIAYTTTVRMRADLAVVPVSQLFASSVKK